MGRSADLVNLQIRATINIEVSRDSMTGAGRCQKVLPNGTHLELFKSATIAAIIVSVCMDGDGRLVNAQGDEG